MPDSRSENPGKPRQIGAILSGTVLGLFLARFFLVAESAGQGETLWIVCLWIMASLILGVLSRESAGPMRLIDLSVLLLVVGHVLSALIVVTSSGEKRTAVNLAWEWIGVGVGFQLLRRACQHREFRIEMRAGLVAVGTAVACLGVYQHYAEFPQMSARYGPVFDRLRNSTDPVEIEMLRRKLAEDQMPVDGPGLTLFEKRLRDSREPLGFFALANTFGGFLAVCLIIEVSNAIASMRRGGEPFRWQGLVWIVMFVGVGWCLLLTKSRTAWIGTTVGLFVWLSRSGQLKISRVVIYRTILVAIALIVVGWGLTRLGGLDRQVLTEAPKSLQYRLQYWRATWPMIVAHPWWGVGPGQFRSNYLRYKLPEASEEIADPHNLFLDVAASGGIIAFVGLLGVCLAVVRGAKSVDQSLDTPPDRPTMWRIATGLFSIAIISWCLVVVTGLDDRFVILIPLAAGLYLLLRQMIPWNDEQQQGVRAGDWAAATCLIIHLLGAGGIEMPAVSLLLLGLLALGQGVEGPTQTSQPQVVTILFVPIMLVLLGLVVYTGVVPVSTAQYAVQAGDQLVAKGLLKAADEKYRTATVADSLSPDPRRRRAELAFRQAQETRFRSAEQFQSAIDRLNEARLSDPLNPHLEIQLGEWWLERYRVTRDREHAQQAVAALEQAWQRYPTNVLLMAALADAYDATAKPFDCRRVALKALEQDRINHVYGHVDRYLPDPLREKLEHWSRDQD